MPRRSIHRVVAGALSVFALGPVAGASATPSRSIADRINAIRVANGLPKLRLAPGLTRAARAHSLTLARRDALTHDGFAARIRAAAIPGWRTAGENVAAVSGCGTGAAFDVVRAWMGSPPHRRNILSPRFRMIGTAMVVRGNCDTAYATAEFAG